MQPLNADIVATGSEAGAPPAAAQRRPLMGLLEQAPAALDQARIDVYGHVEAGYTYNFNHPGGLNFGRVFDFFDNEVVLDQLDLNIERRVDPRGGQWDLGGRVELLYGTDAAFLHSSGLGEHFNLAKGSDVQFDLLQCYADLALPVGDGLRLRAGKFLYFYPIDPNLTLFYSRGFSFDAAFPKTLTGVSGEYRVSDQLVAEGGVSVGWDKTLRDNNQAIDVFGRFRYDFSRQTNLTVRAIAGPEQTHDNGDWRIAVDVALAHRLTPEVSLFLNPIFGYQPNAFETFGTPASLLPATWDAYWYGVTAAATWSLNQYVSLGARGEVYRDDGGATTNVLGVSQTLYEATIGATIRPFPSDPIGKNLKLRPEVRYDYSTARYFGGGGPTSTGTHDQTTFAVDAIFNF